MKVSSGVPQGSSFGPDFGTLSTTGVLELQLLENVHLIGFADDLSMVASARTEKALIETVNHSIQVIITWTKSQMALN